MIISSVVVKEILSYVELRLCPVDPSFKIEVADMVECRNVLRKSFFICFAKKNFVFHTHDLNVSAYQEKIATCNNIKVYPRIFFSVTSG